MMASTTSVLIIPFFTTRALIWSVGGLSTDTVSEEHMSLEQFSFLRVRNNRQYISFQTYIITNNSCQRCPRDTIHWSEKLKAVSHNSITTHCLKSEQNRFFSGPISTFQIQNSITSMFY